MKKVCFFISSISEAGGTARVCTEIANKLALSNYDVTILSFYGELPFFALEPSVKALSVFDKKHNFKLLLPLVVLKLRNRLSNIDPDFLVNVDSALFVYSWVAGWGLRFKNIVWEQFNFHVSLGAPIRPIARKLAAKHSSAIITLTHKDISNWESSLTCKAPVIAINNPSPVNTAVGSNKRQPVVLAIGRLTYQKGFDRLLNVWQQVQKKHPFNWELHIVGSGELKNELEDKIKQLAITVSVKLIPATNNVQQHYNEASIFCMTSLFEGLPMVLLEAQAFGLPIVSYDCETGPAEVINSDNGILVKDGDEKALANALIYLIANENIRLNMGLKALENSSKFKIDTIIQQWTDLFETKLA